MPGVWQASPLHCRTAPALLQISSGDTLAAIGIKFGTTVDAILELNPSITDPNKIVAGE